VQLDKTRIAIRERDLPELLDISLHVLRVYARPLLLTFALLAVPLALLNQYLIGWTADIDYRDEVPWNYLLWMSLFVLIEAPLASLFATAYLGEAMFHEQPRMRDVIWGVFKRPPGRSWLEAPWVGVMWCIVILRGPAAAIFLAYTLDPFEEPPAVQLVFLFLIGLGAAAIRAMRPYIVEIVLLERNPLGLTKSRGKPDDALRTTIGQRSATLHGTSGGDLIGRWIGTAAAAAALVLAVQCTFWFFMGIFLNTWSWGPVMTEVFAPLSMWLVACYFTVVRFLSYLDLRIRTEGWEVELRLRAEAGRLSRAVV
jgi:hypothetical protein